MLGYTSGLGRRRHRAGNIFEYVNFINAAAGMTQPKIPPHTRFEQQIERIHQLLEAADSVVTWNDSIPDPDNPAQPRQIDVSVRRDGSLTLIECRLHKEPQDVTWIEELIGRRLSFKADAVIAVSSSGFTTTARKKAEAFGIHLRDFANLSDEEIQNWGCTRTITLKFCEFSQAVLNIQVSEPPLPGPPRLTDLDGNAPSPLVWASLYQSIVRELIQKNWPGVAEVDVDMNPKLLVNGEPPLSVSFHAKVQRISQVVRLASVFEYADPLTSDGHAEVGHYSLGNSEIIEDQNDNVAMTLDLSSITVPDGCWFETVTVDAGRVVNVRPRLIGFEQALNARIPVQIRYSFPRSPSTD